MKIKNYLLMILFPIFMIFAFSPIVSAQDTENPEVQTETQIDENEVNDQTGETEEKSEEEKKSTEPAEKSTPQAPAETIAGSETEEKNGTKERTDIEQKKPEEKNDQPQNDNSNYVVEFTHKDLQYILSGGTSVKLSKILDKLEIKGSKITEVKSSNNSLFSATKESGEWTINSHKAFHTDEYLYVVIDDTKYNVKVTDYSLPQNKWMWLDSPTCTIARTTDRIDQNSGDVEKIYGYYYYETRTLKIAGSGQLKDYGEEGSPMWNMCGSLTGTGDNWAQHIEIDDRITYIGNNFFYAVNRIGKSKQAAAANYQSCTVHLPNALTSIGDYAFQESGVSAVYIPDNVASIGQKAFQYCPNLMNVLIPNSIGNSATKISSGAFNNTPNNCHFYVGASCGNLHIACGNNVSNRFGNYANQYFHWYGCKAGSTMYAFPKAGSSGELVGHPGNYSTMPQDSTRTQLEIVGYGDMYDFYTSAGIAAPWEDYRINFTEITFNTIFGDSNVSGYDRNFNHIGESAFLNCSNVTKVTLPADLTSSSLLSNTDSHKLTSIGEAAFLGCSRLTTIRPNGSSVNTFPSGVTVISKEVLSACTNLQTFNIPSNVTSIGEAAFKGCSSLTTIRPNGSSVNTFPSGVTVISKEVLRACTSLQTFNIQSNVTLIGSSAFRGCTSLRSVSYSSSTTSLSLAIGDYAFAGCTNANFTNTNFPDRLTTIGDHAFDGCSNLTTVNITKNVTTIGLQAFYGCKKISSLTFANDGSADLQIQHGAFQLSMQTGSNDVTITFPDRLKYIGEYAFSNCSKVVQVTIPNSIANSGSTYALDDNSFIGLANRASIYYRGTESDFISKCEPFAYVSSSVANVFGWDIDATDANSYIYHFKCGNDLWYAVDGYNHTTTITGSGAMYDYTTSTTPFKNHSNITTIDMRAGTSIGRYAFYQCTNISSVSLPSTLTQISWCAFEQCSNSNFTSIVLPSGLISIETGAFWHVPLTSVKVAGHTGASDPNTIPSSVTQISPLAFSDTDITSFTIPNTITAILGNANSDWGAFQDCTNLTSITIPTSVTEIGRSAFKGCSNLATVNFEGNTTASPYSNNLTSIGQNAFAGLNANADIWYRYGNKASLINKCYDEATLNSSFGAGNTYVYHFVISEGQCGPALYWDVTQTYQYVPSGDDTDETVMNVTGTDNFYSSYRNNNRPWQNNKNASGSSASGEDNEITKVVISSGVTDIGQNVFKRLHALTSVVIPDSITAINTDAFWACENLATITVAGSSPVRQLSSGLTTMGAGAFGECTSLTSITIPASVTVIQDGSQDDWGAFAGCTSLTSVTFEGAAPSITTIGRGAFYGCTSLTSVKPSDSLVNTFPSGVTTLSQSVFQGCNHLPSFTIQNTVTLVGPSAFNGCTALVGDTGIADQLTIPSGITSIGNNAFNSCTGLTTVTFEKTANETYTITNIGSGAFHGCSSLANVTIPTSITSRGLGQNAFAGLASKANIYYDGTESAFAIKCSTSSDQGVSDVAYVFGYDIAGTAANNYIYHFKCGPYVWYSLNATSGTTLLVNIYINENETIPPEVPTIGTYDWSSSSPSPFYSHGGPSGSGLPMDVTVGDRIQYIGRSIFQGCVALTNLNLPPRTLASTGEDICNGCTNLVGVYGLNVNLQIIKSRSFKGCENLDQINILNNNLKIIQDEAFMGCSTLNAARFSIPSTVTSIEDSALYGCSSLASVTIPTGIESVGKDAFAQMGTNSRTITYPFYDIKKVDITYEGKQETLEGKCSEGTLTGSFGYEAINDGKYTFHFTQDITYISNGSTVTVGEEFRSYITATDTAVDLPILADTASASFSGWYTQQDPNTVITQMTPQKSGPYGDLTYYAKWTLTVRTITYHLNGGTFGSITPVTEFRPQSGETVNLSLPTKTDDTFTPPKTYVFLGWHFLQSLTDTAFASFVADSTHTDDVTVYAEWYDRTDVRYWANGSKTVWTDNNADNDNYEIIKPWETTLGASGTTTWYVLKDDVIFEPGTRLNILGDVHLILTDNRKLEVDYGIAVNKGNSITVYAQDSDQHYIAQDYSAIDDVLVKLKLQPIQQTTEIDGVTYGGAKDKNTIINLSNGNVYYLNHDVDEGEGSSYSDGSTTLVFGNSTWNSDEKYYMAGDGVTKYYEYQDEDSEGRYYVTADGGVTKYYYVEYVAKVINTQNKNDYFWIPESVVPSEDEKGRYITLDGGVTKYYISDDGSYISADDGATKYYDATYYDLLINRSHEEDPIPIHKESWEEVNPTYYFDTDTLKTYYMEYDRDKECYYYYETTDTEQTNKYYETELGSIFFTNDIDEYNRLQGNITKPGMIAAAPYLSEGPLGATIGGDEKNINGNITIYGGNYALTSYWGLPVIGTGWFYEHDENVPAENNSTITINGGNFDILRSEPYTSHGETLGGNLIGGGAYANGGEIEINGGRLILRDDLLEEGELQYATSVIGAGYGVSAADNNTTVKLSWTNITDFIMINTTTDGISAINCSELTFGQDGSGNPKKFVFADEDRITASSYATETTIAGRSYEGFTLIPYPEDIQYALQIPYRVVIPFRKTLYPPTDQDALEISVQTRPDDDENTPNVDESIPPLVKPYQLILAMAKNDFERVEGEDLSSSDPKIVFDLVNENGNSMVGVDEYFSSDSNNYDHYQVTHLGGCESTRVSIAASEWQQTPQLKSGKYQGSITFDVGLATNGASPGELPFSFDHIDSSGGAH